MRVTAREAERVRRQRDEAGAAPAHGDERARILRLQASAGNQAVTQLLRVSASGKKRLKKEPGGVTLTAMQAFQTAGGLSDADVDAMLRLGEDELEEAVKLDAAAFKGCAGETDMSARLRFAKAAATKPKTAQVKTPQPRDAVVEAVCDAGVLEPDARSFVNKAGAGAAKTWIAGKGKPAVAAAVRVCQGAATLGDIDSLLLFDAGLRGYGADVVLPLAAEHSLAAVRVALEQTQGDKSANYLTAWLSLGATAASPQSFKDLIRLKGRLLDNVPGMAVFQADNQYMGASDYPHSRTGFLRYQFGGGSFVELHTHWNENVHKLVSIHVKDGPDKSTELNSWPSGFFGEVNTAVLAAHNLATGLLAPTGGALTL
jgi:hypothetical protein